MPRSSLSLSFFITLLLAASASLWAADQPKHDLYLSVLLSGQAQVMGSRSAVVSGVYRSSDRINVEHVGFPHIRMMSVVGDPQNPNGLYFTALNGVIHSPDRGKTWRILTSWDMTEPKGLAIDPHARDHFYVGLPDGIGVSTDAGKTWRHSNDGIRRGYTHPIIVDRTRAGRVLAGTERGIYVSDDGAKTWKLAYETKDVTYDLRQSPHDPKVFFAVTSTSGALLSSDGGTTWKRLEAISSAHTLHYGTFDPTNAQRLALCGWEAGVQVSEDGGRTWTDRTAGLPNRQVWCVASDPDFPGRLYAAPYLQPVHVSDDFGRTWKPLFFEKATVFSMSFVARP